MVESALDELGVLFDRAPFEWYLGGGLAIDAALGTWTRRHNDVDLLVPEPSLKPFAEHVARHGYRMMRVVWRPMMHGRKISVYRPADIDREHERLCAVTTSARYPLLRCLEVYPLADNQDGTVTHYDIGVIVPWTELNGSAYTTRTGYRVPLSNLHHSRRLKEYWWSQRPTMKAHHDLTVIDTMAPASSNL